MLQQLWHAQNTISKVQIKRGKERTATSSVCLTISSFLLLLAAEIAKTNIAVTKYSFIWETKDYPEVLHSKNGFKNLAHILAVTVVIAGITMVVNLHTSSIAFTCYHQL